MVVEPASSNLARLVATTCSPSFDRLARCARGSRRRRSIGPFLKRLPDVPAEFQVELIVYTVVVTYSGLLAAYYLFFARETRAAFEPPPVVPA